MRHGKITSENVFITDILENSVLTVDASGEVIGSGFLVSDVTGGSTQIQSDVDTISGDLNDLTVTVDGISADVQELKENTYFDAYDSTGGVALNTVSYVDYVFDVVRTSSPDISGDVTTGIISILRDGLYRLQYRASVTKTAGGRTSIETRIAIDEGGGFLELAGTKGYTYSRNTTDGEGTAVGFCIINLVNGDRIKVQGILLSGSGVETIADGSSFIIERVVER